MNFWWVSQNQTWNQEISGGYMCHQLTSDGKNIFHYENMLLVKKGDIVLSYYDQKIQALGIITSEAYDFPKPLEFRSAGDDWNTDGWKVDVTYKDLNPPLSPKDFGMSYNRSCRQDIHHLIIMEADIKDIYSRFRIIWLHWY